MGELEEAEKRRKKQRKKYKIRKVCVLMIKSTGSKEIYKFKTALIWISLFYYVGLAMYFYGRLLPQIHLAGATLLSYPFKFVVTCILRQY